MKTCYAILFGIILTNILSAQTIRYVRSGGNGNGSSWQDASGSLQSMIQASGTTDEIWVAAGIYKPETQIQAPTDFSNPIERNSTFTLKSGLKLYGGFPANGSPTMNDRNSDLHETILSGDIGIANDSSDNCFHVLFFPNLNNIVIDGFTITGGAANANGANGAPTSYVPSLTQDIYNYYGGAAYLYQGDSIQFSNCKIVANIAGYEGGAIYVNGGNHLFQNNTFESNKGGGFGGAVYGTNCTLIFNENNFTDNQVIKQSGGQFPMPTPNFYASGGAIASKLSSLEITNNLFEDNIAIVPSNTNNTQGGALYLENGTHIITENQFINNQSLYLPTGVQVSFGGAVYLSNANSTIEKNEFIENITHGSGGALYFTSGNHLVKSNLFEGNNAVGLGGAMSCSSTTLKAVNNIFNRNSCGNKGGAVHSAFTGGINTFVNNTFYGNTAIQDGGAMYFDTSQDSVLNTIFWANAINGNSTGFGSDLSSNSSNLKLNNNLYQSVSPVDPLFEDEANGNFALSSGSPAINAGSNTYYLTTYGNEDFLGNNRIYADTIDIGAIEFQGGVITSEPAFDLTALFEFYPNPTAGNVYINVTEKTWCSILNMRGEIVFKGSINKSAAVDLSHLSSGVYIVNVQSLSSLKSLKLVKM